MYLAPSTPEELTPRSCLLSGGTPYVPSKIHPSTRPGAVSWKPVQRSSLVSPPAVSPTLELQRLSQFRFVGPRWACAQRPSLTSAWLQVGHPCFPVSAGAPGLTSSAPSWAGLTGLGSAWAWRKAWECKSVPPRAYLRSPRTLGAADCSHLAMGYDSEVNLTDCLGTRFQAKEKRNGTYSMLRYATVPRHRTKDLAFFRESWPCTV